MFHTGLTFMLYNCIVYFFIVETSFVSIKLISLSDTISCLFADQPCLERVNLQAALRAAGGQQLKSVLMLPISQ